MALFNDINLVYAIFMFFGLLIIMEGFISYWQQGISLETGARRFIGYIISAALSLLLSFITMDSSSERMNDFLIIASIPIIISLFILVQGRRKVEATIKKYPPHLFFVILEGHLKDNGYDYIKNSKADDEFVSSSYITHYSMANSKEEIKVNWKDLEQTNVKMAFSHFEDKDLIKEIILKLRDQRSSLPFYPFTLLSIVIGAAIIGFSIFKLLEY